MFPFFFDPTYILILPGLIIALWAQAKVRSAYAKWSRIRTKSGLSGAEIAKIILQGYRLDDIPIREIPGELTDNYDPIKKRLNLSSEVFNSDSVAALGIAAHEAGHAIQHNYGYIPLTVRNGIYPIANFGSMLAFPLFFLGIILGYNKFLIDLAIYLFAGFVAFTLITLPVEFNASKRAVAILTNTGYLTSAELAGVKEVLSAAALTYVASALTALLQLLRLLILRGDRD